MTRQTAKQGEAAPRQEEQEHSLQIEPGGEVSVWTPPVSVVVGWMRSPSAVFTLSRVFHTKWTWTLPRAVKKVYGSIRSSATKAG
jgi:hypothetical protein